MIRRFWPGLLLLISGFACAQGGGVSTLNFNVINPTTGQCLAYVGNTSGGVWVNSSSCGGGGGGITALTGDVTASGSGSVAASVVRVNGLAVPASQTCVGTNSSSQFITGSCGGTPGGSSGAIQYNNAGAFGGITLGSNTLLGNSGSGAAALSTSSATLADIQATTTFTVAGTGCTPSAHAGGPFGGTITLASGPCTSIVVTLNGSTGFTAPNGYHCSVSDRTALAAGTWIPAWGESASTTTTATIPIPGAAGSTDVVSFSCDWY